MGDGARAQGIPMIRLFLILAVSCAAQTHHEFRDALVKHEGYSTKPYQVQGIWHVGIGHRLDLKAEAIREWTPYEVERVFTKDLDAAIQGARTVFPSYPRQPKAVRILLVDLTFQCGQKGVSEFRRFRAAIERRDYLRAAEELRRSKLASQTPGRVESHVKVLTKAAKGVE